MGAAGSEARQLWPSGVRCHLKADISCGMEKRHHCPAMRTVGGVSVALESAVRVVRSWREKAQDKILGNHFHSIRWREASFYIK